MRSRAAASVSALMLAACMSFGARAPADGDGRFAEYLRQTRAMDAAQLEVETARLAKRTEAPARLRFAMLLAAPQHAQRDDARALALADEIARSDGAPVATRDAAALFVQWLGEARRRDQDMRRAQERASADQKRIEQLETRLRDADKRAQDAERKLEALKQIDREMTDRPNGNVTRP